MRQPQLVSNCEEKEACCSYGVWWLVILAAALALLNACGGGSGFFGSSLATHLAYVATGQDILAYRVNNKSGSAQILPGSPFLAGSSPSTVVVHPSNQLAFGANPREPTISLFLRASPA